ncbi:TPA: methyl-accepting chemotaxis protein [Bacillus pacificus]|uniref:methyl-accepting chemotaxis protein n=1 Tax=Bacillus TaxID=1386 RepID=UPI00027CCB93|nr:MULTISPECIES: methyl-accepting chemotaxis protein [unclassified Bacillus cereus group]AFQ13307.1 methyl-accepting chemotaxis sensory transducer [Bacillus cereus FRI-35]MDX5841079.1 methyl-accepting chemotaxis protein [Bacillus cereus group sp. BfR-BA-01700]MDX5846220.1 methyl-accepting chemotaxis protein [Bacillus cereus group sp. BfR-BA-01233]MDX5941866.1 methyl-accepting chemotaxis protein [Bacillus cereus group sp. BfR-BA-00415]
MDQTLYEKNRIMLYSLLVIASINMLMLYLMAKPLNLILTITSSTIFVTVIMYYLIERNFQRAATYWYTIGINSIVIIYIFKDQNIGNLLFLAVCLAMTILYQNWKNTLLSGIIAVTQLIVTFIFIPGAFGEQKVQLLCYFLFSYIVLTSLLTFSCYFTSKLQQKIKHTSDKAVKDAAAVEKAYKQNKENTKLIDKFATSLNQNVIVLNSGTKEMNQSFSELNDTFAMQGNSMGEVSLHLVNIKEQTEDIQGSTNGLMKYNTECEIVINDSSKEIHELKNIIQELNNVFLQNVETANRLDQKMEDIQSIIRSINEISHTINLLSLNASIEAARAGEHGKGFAVVAGEIKKLAFLSNKSTTEISTILQEVQQETEESKDITNSSKLYIEKTLENSNKVEEVFETILQTSMRTKEEIRNIFNRINVLKDSISGTSEQLVNLNVVSEENNSNLDQLKKNFEEITHQFDHIQEEFSEMNALVQGNEL